MINQIPYAGHFWGDPNMRDYVDYLIKNDLYDLHKRNLEYWEIWYHSMEVE